MGGRIGYNWDGLSHRRAFPKIKSQHILATIRDISEVFALAEEPRNLLNMVVDTLAEALGAECCWVQTIDPDERRLRLCAERGFTAEMRREMLAVELSHPFSQQVVGLGDGAIVPDLSRDGYLGLGAFRAAGYRWVVAVPMMTYRVHGLLGVASRRKRQLKYVKELISVVGGLIAVVLGRGRVSRTAAQELARQALAKELLEGRAASAQAAPAAGTTGAEVDEKSGAGGICTASLSHSRQMASFRRWHQTRPGKKLEA